MVALPGEAEWSSSSMESGGQLKWRGASSGMEGVEGDGLLTVSADNWDIMIPQSAVLWMI